MPVGPRKSYEGKSELRKGAKNRFFSIVKRDLPQNSLFLTTSFNYALVWHPTSDIPWVNCSPSTSTVKVFIKSLFFFNDGRRSVLRISHQMNEVLGRSAISYAGPRAATYCNGDTATFHWLKLE